MDIGARLVVTDESGGVTGIEEAGRRIAESVGIGLKLGEPVSRTQLESLADYMAARVTEVIRRKPLSPATERLLRTPDLGYSGRIDGIVFSGGVSEFIYEDSKESFGDLGPLLAAAVRRSLAELGAEVLRPRAGIRATVIGASQYTVQVSGSTIYISSLDAVPVRNVPVVHPEIAFADAIDAGAVEAAVDRSVRRFDLHEAGTPVALMLEWEGTATFHRLNGLCRGIIAGLNEKLQRGTPLVLVSRGDIGGLLGIHMKEELRVSNPVISIDGIRLSEFDFVDIGNFIPSSGAVPVIIKSLVFPS
jgi:ethanolamine utilization protein EutA